MKYNRNNFNLLLERMSNRYSYDESIELINRQLLTEGFGNKFFQRLKGVDVKLRTPQINRLYKVMGGLDDVNLAKNIDDILYTKGPDGASGVKLFTNDLQKAGINLTKLDLNEIDNYFKILKGVDDAFKGNVDNSIIGVINRLDDTNLTLKQKEKLIDEAFKDNPDLINSGMPSGKKVDYNIEDGNIVYKNNSGISKSIDDNFIHLSSKNVKQFVKEKITKIKTKSTSPKKIIKNNNFDSGDFLVSDPKSGTFYLLKAEDATTNVKTKLKKEGYDVISVDKPSSKFKKKVEGKSDVPVAKLREEISEGIWFRTKKYLKIYGYITEVQLALFIIECMSRMVFDDYKEYDIDAPIGAEDKYTITKKYDIRDCIRTKLIASQDPNNPDPVSNMNIQWWEVFIPGGPVIPRTITYLIGSTVDFERTVNDLEKLVYSTSERIIEKALEKLSIKEIVNYDCEKVSKDNISGVLKSDSEESIVNNIFEKITGYGVVDTEELSDAIDSSVDKLGGVKSDYDAMMDKIDIEIKNNNDGLDEKYKMKNYGMLERTKHFCRRQKLHFIKKRINMVTEQSKSSEGNMENWCSVNTAKLDIYSSDGFRETDDPNTETFSVDNCKNTKNEIKQLIILTHNYKPEDAKGLDNLDILSNCEDTELSLLESNQDYCYVTPIENEELDNILDGLENVEVDITIYKKDVSNKFYDWQYDPDKEYDSPTTCSDLQSIFIAHTKGPNKNEITTILSDGTELIEGEDWKVENGNIVYKINEKVIRFFENNYSYFCSSDKFNEVEVNGEKVTKTKSDCINELVNYFKNESGCWGNFYGI